MKKVAFLLLSSCLILGACSSHDKTAKDVKESTHKKDNPKAHKGTGDSDRTDGKKINKH
ncbi:hypothetical protein [Staphylococcus sp. Marseille-Q1834]|uniref:hypothetical protein n=1 Tax=Staphylococcus sp. Marseille-Q1834 TaxID=2866594 RepID=UPI001649C8DF|nr:hypothetical protein [Staphylococcus sp. Marseille-Q1834]